MSHPDESFLENLLNKLDNWMETGSGFSAARMTRDLYPYRQLFSPIQINNLYVKNRIVMGPMGNVYMAEESGRPSQKMVSFLTERARGGVGLITTGLVPIGQGIDPGLTELGDRSLFPRIDRSRSFYSGWRTLVENIHSHAARLFIQLSPGAGRVGSPLTLLTKLRLPVSASWNPNFYLPSIPCRPLIGLEIRALVRRMAQAAADAKQLGIDGVYIHGHEGYLLDQFTNKAFNRRRFSRYATWQRLGLDIVRAVRARVGYDYPIMYRIGLSAALNATYGTRMRSIPNLRKFRRERLVAETLQFMLALVRAGADIFDIDLGVYDNWWLPHPPNSMPSGCYLAIARLVKEYFLEKQVKTNRGQSVPIVAVGKLGYPDIAEKALRDGHADLIMLARPLLADPDWANKAFAGHTSAIRPCIGDQEACLNAFVAGTHVQCAVNPRTGFEDVLPNMPQPAKMPQKIAVVGAGPAGILCALAASRRGHYVTLFEKSKRVGGMLVPGSLPGIKYEVANYLTYLESELSQAQKSSGLKIKTNTEVTAEQIKKGKFDIAVVCTGGKSIKPQATGSQLPYVLQAVELLKDPKLVRKAKRVVIIGGGSVGCEVAHWLAVEQGKQVTIVELLPHLMRDTVTANRGHLIHLLEKNGVRVMNCATLVKVNTDSVEISRNVHASVPDPFNTWNPILPQNVQNPLARKIKQDYQAETIPADLVVLVAGLLPDPSIYERCVQIQAAPQIHIIGDAFQIGRIWEAVKSGYELGCQL